jgi:hypothetical protein
MAFPVPRPDRLAVALSSPGEEYGGSLAVRHLVWAHSPEGLITHKIIRAVAT